MASFMPFFKRLVGYKTLRFETMSDNVNVRYRRTARDSRRYWWEN